MKTEYLISMIENLLNTGTSVYRVYDALKLADINMLINEINGIARITSGDYEPVEGLYQSNVSMRVDFMVDTAKVSNVKEHLINVAKNSAGLVIANNTISSTLEGTTGVTVVYPQTNNYYDGTMGTNVKIAIVVYFDINEKAELANGCQFFLGEDSYTELASPSTADGTYYTYSEGVYTAVTLPDDYVSGTTYYELTTTWEKITAYGRSITRNIYSTTDKYENEEEMQSINDGQTLEISFVCPSIVGSKMNELKKMYIRGTYYNEQYKIKLVDSDGEFVFDKMIVSGKMPVNYDPGKEITFPITFVKGRGDVE